MKIPDANRDLLPPLSLAPLYLGAVFHPRLMLAFLLASASRGVTLISIRRGVVEAIHVSLDRVGIPCAAFRMPAWDPKRSEPRTTLGVPFFISTVRKI
jgi:hypothetical protein